MHLQLLDDIRGSSYGSMQEFASETVAIPLRDGKAQCVCQAARHLHNVYERSARDWAEEG